MLVVITYKCVYIGNIYINTNNNK